MIRENPHLVIEEPLKFKIARKLPIILEEFIEYTPIYPTKTGGCQRVTDWTCKLNNRVWTDYAQKSPRCYIGKPAYLWMPKFLTGYQYNEEQINRHLKKI